jgi:hypothetical protein
VESVSPRHELDGKEVALVEFLAIRRDRIDLICRICVADIASRGVATTGDLDVDDAAVRFQSRPFALNPEKARSKLEDEVVAAMLELRPKDIDPELDGGGRNRGLGDVALVVAVVHERMFAYKGIRDKAPLSGKCEIGGG